ncbi:D-alanine--D-alanine ligase [Helicobacter sp. faydin-H20]|uniref:D-alanine--D-alanine ligase n=1 Tax=Helicobacter anatolicus TaxID=2905874 RepID=UPI001E51B455|nr:D-alanine--D-alanine ligase [Helicobacter anatolicus]MCE3036491.1 D-alanine--D-alanine ligase [Helicobacter anatolicus]
MSFCLLFGGLSWEHEISIVSAITIKNTLKQEIKHFIFVDENHQFYEVLEQEMQADFFANKKYKNKKPLQLDFKGFYFSTFFTKKYLAFDTLINLVHGGDGEDGVLASLLDFYNIPFIGPRIEASVLSYNKYYTKLFAQARNVKTLPFEILTQKDSRKTSFDFPVIIKPAKLGSSIGIGIATDSKSFDFVLDQAFEYDDMVLIEPFYKGIKEYNLAGCKIKDSFCLSIIEEPKKEDLLNFEDKYLDFSRDKKTTQAFITPQLEKEMQENFKYIYENCFEGALIRCDFFVHNDTLYLNEINPIPGSMANYLFDDFKTILQNLAQNLPAKKPIFIDYRYIKKIQKAK